MWLTHGPIIGKACKDPDMINELIGTRKLLLHQHMLQLTQWNRSKRRKLPEDHLELHNLMELPIWRAMTYDNGGMISSDTKVKRISIAIPGNRFTPPFAQRVIRNIVRVLQIPSSSWLILSAHLTVSKRVHPPPPSLHSYHRKPLKDRPHCQSKVMTLDSWILFRHQLWEYGLPLYENLIVYQFNAVHLCIEETVKGNILRSDSSCSITDAQGGASSRGTG
jgi:hypothetical protein